MSAEDILLQRLERALGHAGDTHTVLDVLGMVAGGDAQMFGGSSGMVVTEVLRYPRSASVRVWLGAGERDAVLALHPQVEQFAREVGASRMELVGRPGWIRPAAPLGWKPRGVWMTKELAP